VKTRARSAGVLLPASRAQAFGIDCQRKWMVAADENRPERVRLKTPQSVIAEHALRFEISDHRGRSRHLNWRTAIGPIKAHHGRCPAGKDSAAPVRQDLFGSPAHYQALPAPQGKGSPTGTPCMFARIAALRARRRRPGRRGDQSSGSGSAAARRTASPGLSASAGL
jgi:hypothetical protein